MPSVLIVDDDAQIRSLLRKCFEIQGWSAYEADEAKSALRMIQSRTKIHAAVIDIRMPAISGLILMAALKKTEADRDLAIVVISGGATEEEERALPHFNHLAYFRKPFQVTDLTDLLNRHVGWDGGRRARIDGRSESDETPEEVKEVAEVSFRGIDDLLGRMSKTLTVPVVLQRLIEIVESDTSGAKDLAEIARLDPSLSARLLRLVNSSFYAASANITDLTAAVVRLGFNAVKNLMLSAELYRFLRSSSRVGLDKELLWLHCIGVAVSAKRLALAVGMRKEAEALFTAGLLHDMGKFLLDEYAHEDYANVLRLAARERLSLAEAERRWFGVDHCDVARAVMERWRLPATLAVPATEHHAAADQVIGRHGSHARACAAIVLADRVLPLLQIGYSGHDRLHDIEAEWFTLLGIKAENTWKHLAGMDNDLVAVLDFFDAKHLLALRSTQVVKSSGKAAIVGYNEEKGGLCASYHYLKHCGLEVRVFRDAAELPALLSGWKPTVVKLYAAALPKADDMETFIDLVSLAGCVERLIVVGDEAAPKRYSAPGIKEYYICASASGTRDLM